MNTLNANNMPNQVIKELYLQNNELDSQAVADILDGLSVGSMANAKAKARKSVAATSMGEPTMRSQRPSDLKVKERAMKILVLFWDSYHLIIIFIFSNSSTPMTSPLPHRCPWCPSLLRT